MEEAIAITKDSFSITNRGVILELKHSLDGLPKGTRIISVNSNLIWEIKARVLFDHAVKQQKIFENENAEHMLLSFKSLEKRQLSIQKIVEKESQNIFQYMVLPIKHNEKPVDGEALKIVIPTI